MDIIEVREEFFERIAVRLKQAISESQAAEHGESPMVAEVLEMLSPIFEAMRTTPKGDILMLGATMVAALDVFEQLLER